MAQVTFHSMADSAYLWTAMLAADEKQVAYELSPLVLGSADHLRLHPFGKMPVLQHGDVFLYETLAICHYLDRAFDGPARPCSLPMRWARRRCCVGSASSTPMSFRR